MHGMSVRRFRYHIECIDAIECNIWIELIRVEVRKLQLSYRSIYEYVDLNLSVALPMVTQVVDVVSDQSADIASYVTQYHGGQVDSYHELFI
jgi:hypothetical protein